MLAGGVRDYDLVIIGFSFFEPGNSGFYGPRAGADFRSHMGEFTFAFERLLVKPVYEMVLCCSFASGVHDSSVQRGLI